MASPSNAWRAGLDYHDCADIRLHRNWRECARAFSAQRVFAITTKGSTRYCSMNFLPGDVFLFGPESRGLPSGMLDTFPSGRRLRIPMLDYSRSLNLSNAVAILVYEAWRQNGFKQGA
jgi:tRNA (cytidine/uridine-2'-O-)-methyltransferase